MSDKEMIIDKSNFNDYFYPVKKYKPQKGQVLARFSAMAELIGGFPKDQIVSMLKTNPKGGNLAPQLLRNICNATEKESIRVAKEIATDLANGLSYKEVIDKPYKFFLEVFYWTNEECVPKDSPNWMTIKMLNNVFEEQIGDDQIKISISKPEKYIAEC